MTAPANTRPITNNAGNLFLEADPGHSPPRPGAARPPAAGAARRRGRGLVVAIDPPDRAPTPPGGAAFTRPSSRVETTLAAARKRLRQADASAARILRRPAGRPYAALVALARAGTLLLALSWLGLTLHATTVADHRALRRQAALATTLGTDQARIATLTAQLQQTQLAVQRAQAKSATRNAETPAGAPPPQQTKP